MRYRSKLPHTDKNCEIENCVDRLVNIMWLSKRIAKKPIKCDAEYCILEKTISNLVMYVDKTIQGPRKSGWHGWHATRQS